jgi:hypothetical protein
MSPPAVRKLIGVAAVVLLITAFTAPAALAYCPPDHRCYDACKRQYQLDKKACYDAYKAAYRAFLQQVSCCPKAQGRACTTGGFPSRVRAQRRAWAFRLWRRARVGAVESSSSGHLING